MTTPETLTASNPVNFQNEKGETIYSFMEDVSGTKLNNAIQETVDEVRAKGVDYVILLSHIGNKPSSNYNFQNIIENTTGIDAVLDGHSHDTDQVTMNNKDGEPVIRSATGTKLQGIGCLTISGEDGSLKADLLSWNNDYSVPDLFGMSNELSEPVAAAQDKVDEIMKVKIADTDYDLIIYDPEKKNDQGNPVRIVRNHETNLADLVADAVRAETEAEIALVNGGAVRDTIRAGEINYGEVVTVMPFFNSICVSEVAGQTLLDALEWGAHFQPGEFGGFMQVSGMTYEIDLDVPSSVTIDTEGNFASVEGAYRVKNVMINGEPLDTKKKYRVAGMEFFLKNGGDGYAMFSADDVVVDEICVDSQALIDYLQKDLNGVIPEEYSEPYGQGRITITGGEQQN